MSLAHRFLVWYRDPEREFLRREVEWTLRWMRRPWFWLGAGAQCAAGLGIGEIFGQLFGLLRQSGALSLWPITAVGYVIALGRMAVPFAFMIFLLRRRALIWFEPERREQTLPTPLGPKQVFPAAFFAPVFVMAGVHIVAMMYSAIFQFFGNLWTGTLSPGEFWAHFRPLSWLWLWLEEQGPRFLIRIFGTLRALVWDLALVSLVARFSLGRATQPRLWLLAIIGYTALWLAGQLFYLVAFLPVARLISGQDFLTAILVGLEFALEILFLALFVWLFIINVRHLRSERAMTNLRRVVNA